MCPELDFTFVLLLRGGRQGMRGSWATSSCHFVRRLFCPWQYTGTEIVPRFKNSSSQILHVFSISPLMYPDEDLLNIREKKRIEISYLNYTSIDRCEIYRVFSSMFSLLTLLYIVCMFASAHVIRPLSKRSSFVCKECLLFPTGAKRQKWILFSDEEEWCAIWIWGARKFPFTQGQFYLLLKEKGNTWKIVQLAHVPDERCCSK